MFGLTIYKSKAVAKRNAKVHKQDMFFAAILFQISSLLNDVGAEYIYNEPGSGDVSYTLNDKLFEYNEFTSDFNGFFIDEEIVTFNEFMGRMNEKVKLHSIDGTTIGMF